MADLLPGTSTSIIAENVRTLRASGYSETEAVQKANAYAHDEPEEHDEDEEYEKEATPTAGVPARRFVVVTKDGSGLGWAKKLDEEGEHVCLVIEYDRKPCEMCRQDNPLDKPQVKTIGKDWLHRDSLESAMREYTGPSDYWVFCENNFPKEADALRAKGVKVFGTGELAEKMEHDRQFAVEIAEQAGLPTPETITCTSRDEGLKVLDAHPDVAYVFKPDDGQFNFLTFVPVRQQDADANRETSAYLKHMKQEPGSFVLQERVAGTELNVELWLYEGEPCLGLVTLEAKRKDQANQGEMAGCAGDIVYLTPVDSALVEHTIGKLLPFYQKEKYTGFADVNVILTDKGPMFLEVCNRFGYNSHVTLFLGLATDTVGNILADFMDGYVDDLPSRFRPDMAASVTLFLDHPREGLPLHLDERYESQWYPFDGYKEDGEWLLTGFSTELGIFVDHGLTVTDAFQSCLTKVREQEAVSVPDMHYRTDLGEGGYPNAIVTRYEVLNDQFGHSHRIVGGQVVGR